METLTILQLGKKELEEHFCRKFEVVQVNVSDPANPCDYSLIIRGKVYQADTVPAQRDSPMPANVNGDGALKRGDMFSPIEKSILRAATNEWQTAAIFAEKTGQKCSHSFYALLANLVDRDWLEGSRNGYRLPSGIDTACFG